MNKDKDLDANKEERASTGTKPRCNLAYFLARAPQR